MRAGGDQKSLDKWDGWMSGWMDGWMDEVDGWMNSGREYGVNKFTMIWDTSVQAPSFILPLGRIGGHALSRPLSCWLTGAGSSCHGKGRGHSALPAGLSPGKDQKSLSRAVSLHPSLELALWLQQPEEGPAPRRAGQLLSAAWTCRSWCRVLPRGDSPCWFSLCPVLLQAENIMFLELDLSPPAIFEFERSRDPAEQDPRALHLERLMHLDSLLEDRKSVV